jgi:hypothetical protein
MKPTPEGIESEIRKVPLLDRLEECIGIIGSITTERRTTRISVPVRADDEDQYLVVTLQDAIASVRKAEAE